MSTVADTPEEAVRKGVRSSLIGVIVNLLLALIKCDAGAIGHSFALVADGIESLSDVVSSAVVALGLWWAIKPPDADHPYGHGKVEPMREYFGNPDAAQAPGSLYATGAIRCCSHQSRLVALCRGSRQGH